MESEEMMIFNDQDPKGQARVSFLFPKMGVFVLRSLKRNATSSERMGSTDQIHDDLIWVIVILWDRRGAKKNLRDLGSSRKVALGEKNRSYIDPTHGSLKQAVVVIAGLMIAATQPCEKNLSTRSRLFILWTPYLFSRTKGHRKKIRQFRCI